MSKGGGAPCEPRTIHISCPAVPVDILLQMGYFFQQVGGRICSLATVKPHTLQNTKTQINLKTHSVGVPPV